MLEKLVQAVLAADVVNLILLCLLVTLLVPAFLVYKGKIRINGHTKAFDEAGVTLNRQWYERVNAAVKRTHDIGSLELHRDWSKDEIHELRRKVEPLVRDVDILKSQFGDFKEKFEDFRDDLKKDLSDLKEDFGVKLDLVLKLLTK